jgi:hypothetical protein
MASGTTSSSTPISTSARDLNLMQPPVTFGAHPSHSSDNAPARIAPNLVRVLRPRAAAAYTHGR